jgi:flagellar biogenesis protein FliO
VGVCVLVWVMVRMIGRPMRAVLAERGLIRVLSRRTLESRQVLYVVEVAGKCWLVGVGDRPVLLAELDAEEVGAQCAERRAQSGDPKLQQLLERVWPRRDVGR